MAKCYAECEGYDKTRIKAVHRLGSVCAIGKAQTYKTYATCQVYADGHGYLDVIREGVRYRVAFNSEDKKLSVKTGSEV